VPIDLPNTVSDFMAWKWPQIAPFYEELSRRPINQKNVEAWLADWTHLRRLLEERQARLYVATTLDTSDEGAKLRYHHFLDEIFSLAQGPEQRLKSKLIESRLEPRGLEVPLRNMRTEVALFREANVPLLADELKLANRYDQISGAQTVLWEGQELTIEALRAVLMTEERSVRERAWRLASQRILADRSAINQLWGEFLRLRRQLAANAGFPSYRDYRWRQMLRFDYAPEDCRSFRYAIEEVVVPAANQVYERQRRRLGVDKLRPWDLDQDIYPYSLPAPRPFATAEELESKTALIFQRVDPQLGAYFETMRREKLLDLDSRKNKGPGGYCIDYALARQPFIFMHAMGIHENVQTLLHEGGHAFHVFEQAPLPYQQQCQIPMEFAEVASMSMELLASPYLESAHGGFYTPAEAARARVEHLERMIAFWPYMAVVDAFQHWVYENHEAAADPASCDAQWAALAQRFIPGVDWSGLQSVLETGWHRKVHIHELPFYYVEYGLALLGAVQVWRNARRDQGGAVARYRQALALGGTATLPELFAAAGARFAFNADALREAISLMEQTIEELETV